MRVALIIADLLSKSRDGSVPGKNYAASDESPLLPAMLADIYYGLDDAVAVISQQFKCPGCMIQSESMGDHKIRLDPACADQLDYGINTFILAPDVYQSKSFAPGIVYREGTLICLGDAHNDEPAHGLAQSHRLVQCRLLPAALEDHV